LKIVHCINFIAFNLVEDAFERQKCSCFDRCYYII
jgi:hypothetical protein